MEHAAEVAEPTPEYMSPTDQMRAKNREALAEMRCPGLAKWAQRLAGHGANLVDAAELTALAADTDERRWRIRLFSRTHQYTIIARPPSPQDNANADDGYLGCVVMSRQPLAGEDWARGRDLADGPYCEETWNEIVHDILGYELVRLGK